MTTWLKQIFCNHIWKLEREEYLHHTVNMDTYVFRYNANHKRCIICEKKKIERVGHYIGLGYINANGNIVMGVRGIN